MTNLSVSKRAINTPASAVRKLVPLADIAKEKGIKVYHVNIGQPDIPTPDEILREFRHLKRKILEYAPSTGMPETRLAWSTFYQNKGFDYAPEDIIVTSGGGEGLMFAFFAVADPGDELLVFEPFYTSYAISAGMGNINLKPVTTHIKEGFHLPDRQTIQKAINQKTKGIIICNPNNPTGTVYTKKEIEMIAEVAVTHNLFIISDETYQEIVFEGQKVFPLTRFNQLKDRLIIVDSVSKRFNACGARIGCVVSKNKEVMSSILRFAQGRLSVATVEQLAVINLLKNHQKYVEKVRRIYASRRNVVIKELRKIDGAKFIPSFGAFYIIVEIPVDNSDDFARFLLTDFSHNKETVMISPAGGFYATPGLGRQEIRIAYVLEEKKLKRAIKLLGLALEKYNEYIRVRPSTH
ncbi:pyridoxal phosphate-dependent aminotransferase [Candidatus Gottesmanbacteria bacterium]|nr:pyridoxal phosphate-dependent aminotransferase [Candidatus Gottesmanbacteria bacterium]